MRELSDLMNLALARALEDLHAHAIGLRSAALPVEEELAACVDAARALLQSRTLTRPALCVIGSHQATSGHAAEVYGESELIVAPPHEAAARATKARNKDERLLLYLCSAAPPGEAGLAGLFTLSGEQIAAIIAEQTRSEALRAVLSARARRVRERLKMASLIDLHRYLSIKERQQEALKKVTSDEEEMSAVAALHALPALELVPSTLKTRAVKPNAGWVNSWDKLLGVKAASRLAAAAKTLNTSTEQAALGAALVSGRYVPKHIKDPVQAVKWTVQCAKACAQLARGVTDVKRELLFGLNQRLQRLLMRGAGITDALINKTDDDDDDDVTTPEERDIADVTSELSGKISDLNLDEGLSFSIEGDAEPIKVHTAEPPWAIRWLMRQVGGNETDDFWVYGGSVALNSAEPLFSEADFRAEVECEKHTAFDSDAVDTLSPALKVAFERFFAERAAFFSAIRAWREAHRESILDEGESEELEDNDALLLLACAPLLIAAQLTEACERYVSEYEHFMSKVREHLTDVPGSLRPGLINLDVVYRRGDTQPYHARLLPSHPLFIERALLWRAVEAPPPPLPQVLRVKAAQDLLQPTTLLARGDGLYESRTSTRPTPSGSAAAARDGLRQAWRVLRRAGLLGSLDVEIYDALDPVTTVNALAEELIDLYDGDAEVEHASLELWFSRRTGDIGGEALTGLARLSEVAKGLIATSPGDGPRLQVNERYVERDARTPRHLLISTAATPLAPGSVAPPGGAGDVTVLYEPGASGNIQRTALVGCGSVEAYEACMEQLGGAAHVVIEPPDEPPTLAGAIIHTLVSSGGWPVKPTNACKVLLSYAQNDEHLVMTLINREAREALFAEQLGASLDDLSDGVTRLRDLAEFFPKALDEDFDERHVLGALGKLRGFNALKERFDAPALILNLDSDEGLAWARQYKADHGSRRRSDLVVIEADSDMTSVTRLRVLELKARSQAVVLGRDASKFAEQALLTAARIRALFDPEAPRRAALVEGFRRLVWCGAGQQREAHRWRGVLKDLDERLTRLNSVEVTAECCVVIKDGAGLREEVSHPLTSRTATGDLGDSQEDVQFLLLHASAEAPGLPPEHTTEDTPPVKREPKPAAEDETREDVDTSGTDSGASDHGVAVLGDESAPTVAADPERLIDMEARYQLILSVFREHGLAVTRPEGDAYEEGPGFYIVRVSPGRGVKISAVQRLTEEIKLKLKLKASQEPHTYVDNGAVVFEIPKPDEERYYVDAEALMTRLTLSSAELIAPIGEDIRGAPVSINFSSSDSPHLLIAGTTGSGKSIALETILHGLVETKSPRELELYLVDPKGTELADFERYEHQRGLIGFDGDDAIKLLEENVEEMQRRLKLFKARRARSLAEFNVAVSDDEAIPWRVIVLDEYADLVSTKEERKEIEQLLQRLAQKARSSGIHLIIATQKPSANVLSTVVRSNLPAQLALRVKTASDSRIILDETGAEALAGKGDAFFKTARRVVRVQCAKLKRATNRPDDAPPTSTAIDSDTTR